MKFRFLFLLLFGMLIFSANGCLKSSQGGDNSALIPDISASCNSAQSSSCDSATSGQPIYIGLTSDSDYKCSNIQYISSGQFAMDFSASGNSTTSFDGAFLNATVTSWIDSNGYPISIMTDQTYIACAFVDANGNAKWDTGEAIGESVIDFSNENDAIQDWY